LAWAGSVFFGMAGMVRYQMTPTVAAAANVQVPRRWPDRCALVRDAGKFTLVMALHPQCPCSQASVQELAELRARTGDRLSIVVMFIVPAGAPADWLDTILWKRANDVPGVRVIADHDGTESRRFGATTSGQVALYDPRGNLRFTGGITDGRGHQGDNAGLEAIVDLMHDRMPHIDTTPVYGCSLGVCTIAHTGGKRP
jgi:hypothetical protein